MGANLTEKEQKVLEMRQQGMSYKTIGEHLGYSHQWAWQICKRASRKILKYEKSGIEEDLESFLEKNIPYDGNKENYMMRWNIRKALISINVRDMKAFKEITSAEIKKFDKLSDAERRHLEKMIGT